MFWPFWAGRRRRARVAEVAGLPDFRTRNVFPLVGFSVVVWPVIAPSLTDQKSALPSQPARSLPLKIGWNPASAAAAASGARGRAVRRRRDVLVGAGP